MHQERNLLLGVDIRSDRNRSDFLFPDALTAKLRWNHAAESVDEQTMVGSMHPLGQGKLVFRQSRIRFNDSENVFDGGRLQIGRIGKRYNKALLEPVALSERNEHMMTGLNRERIGDPISKEPVHRAVIDIDYDLCVCHIMKKCLLRYRNRQV